MKTRIVFMALFFAGSLSLAAEKTQTSMDNSKVMSEIRGTFGMVPTFMKEFPPEALPGAWEEFKTIQLSPNTALEPKIKEVIALAVASQIPCRYCVYFHKKTATFNGAKASELKEAIAIAASTRKWSAYFYGSQQDMASFKADVDKMVTSMKNPPKGKEPVTVTDASSAFKDMENTMGFVPNFIKAYPEAGIAGAWNELKGLEMNPNTALNAKTKDLVSLAVSSQVPCQYCTYLDTEFAKADGATAQEIKEAVAMAGLVRHWSTVLNGLRQEDKAFEREVDQIIKHLERGKNLAPKKVSYKEE
ncbi:carboxymuconolactone decarboxylase family protein [Bdellovibrio sp. BCCA]|uniref:carboxymuconolactone decarboxylase family protein n=1 Tax=Bdellovibrio sp. BCCA TaxID=3136281 RepID=UPI0030F204B9